MPRILIVDDEDDTRDSIAELLRNQGFEVETAADGADALSYLRAAAPDVRLILLDLSMPRIDGATFRRHQLADAALAGIPVVIMSGEQNVHAIAVSLAVADVLIKPIELRALIAIVQRYC